MVGLDPRGVIAQRMRGLLQAKTRRADQFERVLELGIDHRRLADPGLGARDRVERRGALAREHLLGVSGGGAQARAVGQYRALGRQLLVLAGRKPGVLELGDAEARELELLRASALALAQLGGASARFGRRAVRRAVLLERRVERGVPVQELEMALRAEQRLISC